MKCIDMYGHIGLPRFMTAEEFIRNMDEYKVEFAVVTNGQFCPDIKELSRAAVHYGSRLRVVGVPLGETPRAIHEGIAAQMD
jgi:hypothetical protein